MKRLILLLFSSLACAQTFTVSGHVVNPNTGVPTGMTITFSLINTGTQQCKVSGTGLIVPNNQVFTPNASTGVISGTLYRNDFIVCGGVSNTQWSYQILGPGVTMPKCALAAVATTSLNVDNAACTNTVPTVTPPTGDTTYCRLDGSNCGFTGNISGQAATFTGALTAASINKVITVDGVTYTGAQAVQSAIQACSTFTNQCTVDARNPTIGVQTFTTNPFSGLNMPITLLTGHYASTPQGCDIQYDMTAFFMDNPSHFHWTGNNTVLCDTTTGSPVFPGGWLGGRLYATTGSITTGTNTLTVASATGINVGSVIIYLGFQQTNLQTTLNGAINASVTSLTCTDCVSGGFQGQSPTQQPWYPNGYIQIDSEIIQCTSLATNAYSNCARGMFGTSPASHSNLATLSAVGACISEVTAVAGTTITLLDNDCAATSLTNTVVQTGVTDVVLDGSILFQGSSRTLAAGAVGYFCEYCSMVKVGPGIKFDSWNFAAVQQIAGRKGYFQQQCQHLGTLGVNSGGVCMWLFGNDSKNVVSGIMCDDLPVCVWFNDRSTAYQVFDGGTSDNTAYLGAANNVGICANNSGLSTRNTIFAGQCNLTASGVAIQMVNSSSGSGKWSTAGLFPSRSSFIFGTVNSGAQLVTSNSYPATGSNDSYIFGDISNASQTTSITIPGGDSFSYSGSGLGNLIQTTTLSAGWGNTATSAISQSAGQGFLITITANGTGIASNPTVTLTAFSSGAVLMHSCKAYQIGGTGNVAATSTVLNTQAQMTITWQAIPVAASTYIFKVECGP